MRYGVGASLGGLQRGELFRAITGEDEVELEARRAGVDDENVQ
jgi:hypothetical protein